LTKGRVMYLHQLSEFWRTVLYIRCVVPPAYVQLSTLTAHRCAPPPHTHITHPNGASKRLAPRYIISLRVCNIIWTQTRTHINKHNITFKHSQFSSNCLTTCSQLTAQNTNTPNILRIPAARNTEHYFLMMVQVSR